MINKSLESTRLPELIASFEKDAEIKLLNFDSEEEEMSYVVNKISQLDSPRKEVFVLARTNRIILELSQRMKLKGIKHLVRTEELNIDDEAAVDEVTLATIHSIKGLEAKAVFVIGCTTINFPCRASEHPIIELVKINDYDKEEEERRLFYVAMSRAKDKLYLTYSGKTHTRFISQKMLNIVNGIEKHEAKLGDAYSKTPHSDFDILSKLKMWRKELSTRLNLPAYIIMHDKTLIEIASMKPQNTEDLRNIRGIGDSKIAKWGDEIIKIANSRIP